MFQLPNTFRLHDRLRRSICLAAFLALCVLPTTLVLAWGAWIRLPWQAGWEAARLSQSLGLDVSLESVRRPSPGLVVFEGLQLADPETGRTVLRCQAAEARRSDPQGPAAEALSIVLRGPEIEVDGLAQLVELVHRGLGQHTDWAKSEIRIGADEVRLQTAWKVRKLTDLEGFLRPVDGGSFGEIGFRLADIPTPEPVRIQLGRDRRQSPARTGLELYTGGGPLPCSLLAWGWPPLKRMGPSAALAGSLWINQQPDGWAYTLTGRLTGIDLSGLITDDCPHRLSGTAQIDIEMAHLLDGRLQDAAGTIQAGGGLISHSLIEAAVASLRLVPGTAPRSPEALLPYTQLGLAFQIDSNGLRMRGLCPAQPRAAVAVDRTGALLSEPDPGGQPVPIAALVRTISPAGTVQVPVTPAAEWLLRVLPRPAPPAAAETALRPSGGLGEPFEQR